MIYHIQRIHEVWMPRTLKNNVWLLKCFVGRDTLDPVCKVPGLWNFGISDKLCFRWNEMVSWVKKHTALFQTHNWEKSSFFSTLVRVLGLKLSQFSENNLPTGLLAEHLNDKSSCTDMASAEENTGCARTKLLSFLFLFQLRALVVITGQLSLGVGVRWCREHHIIRAHCRRSCRCCRNLRKAFLWKQKL